MQVSTPFLSVGELFNAVAAQSTLQRLVDAFNAQSLAVERLTRRVVELETMEQQDVAMQMRMIHLTELLGRQIKGLEDAETRATATRQVQQRRIDDLVVVVSHGSTTLDKTVRRIDDLQRSVKETKAQLQRDVAPMALVDRLQEDQAMLHDRLDTMETLLHEKLNRSEMSRLDSVVAKIQAFAPTATDLTTRIDRVMDMTSQLQRRVEAETERTNQLSSTIATIRVDVDGKVDHVQWLQFTTTSFPKTIDQLEQDTKATATIVNDLVHRDVSLETQYRTLSSKLTSVSSAMTINLEALRTYVKEELATKFNDREMNDVIKEIRHELSCKAWRKETQTMGKDLEDLHKHVNELIQQVAVSTRFLNWYATRGEAYERNLNVVENQLERLAVASAPQHRQPFDNQVRF